MDDSPILTAAAMRAAEQAVMDGGVSVGELMERAGRAVADLVWRVGGRHPALILCGPGNNGGDGYVAARLLAARGMPVRVAATGEPRTGAAQEARARWDGPVGALANATPAHILVDALFGTGLTRPLDAAVQADLARLAAGAAHRIAVDLPSGVATDDGAVLGRVPAFHQTITLGALKPAHLLQPSAAHCGLVLVGAIGVEAASPIRLVGKPRLARPLPGDHKYTRGLVAIVGGAMLGAARLAAAAAAHAGAGYVMLAGEGGGRLPDAVVVRGGDALPAMLGDARLGALLIGPGLGRDARDALDGALAIEAPLVLDGDALRLVTPEVLAKRRASTILTPHEGEFQALFGALPGSKIDRALAAARNSGAVVIYKGADTVIATPGGEAAVSGGASPWLSTAGTGDVLAGIVTAMAARGLDPFAAARAGVWLHGEAARRAGPAFAADDLAQHLPGAIGSAL